MVRLVLAVDWDPIRVFGNPHTLDEYEHYASGITQRLENGATVEDVAEALAEIERTWMGMKTTSTHRMEVAAKLVKLLDNF